MISEDEMIEFVCHRQKGTTNNTRYAELEQKYIKTNVKNLLAYDLSSLNDTMKGVYFILSIFDDMPFSFKKGEEYYVIDEGIIIEVDEDGYNLFKDKVDKCISEWNKSFPQ